MNPRPIGRFCPALLTSFADCDIPYPQPKSGLPEADAGEPLLEPESRMGRAARRTLAGATFKA